MTTKKKVMFTISRCYDCPNCSKERQYCSKYELNLTWHDMTQEYIPEDCKEPDAFIKKDLPSKQKWNLTTSTGEMINSVEQSR